MKTTAATIVFFIGMVMLIAWWLTGHREILEVLARISGVRIQD